MRLTLGVPVIDQYQLTCDFLRSLVNTVVAPDDFEVIIIDNASDEPYPEFTGYPFPVRLIRNEKNRGYYWPILQVKERCNNSSDLIGLSHNDLVVYEQGWDERLKAEFKLEPALGMVGFCGSSEADAKGGRGQGTMCCFRGERGQRQPAGKQIKDFQPAVLLDSLFMAMRPSVVDILDIDERTPLAHFNDKIWPLRAMENGWRVAVLGIEIDHIGGMTEDQVQRYRDDAARWCIDNGIDPAGDGPKALYNEAERRWLSEYRDQKHLIPSRMSGWDLVRSY